MPTCYYYFLETTYFFHLCGKQTVDLAAAAAAANVAYAYIYSNAYTSLNISKDEVNHLMR